MSFKEKKRKLNENNDRIIEKIIVPIKDDNSCLQF